MPPGRSPGGAGSRGRGGDRGRGRGRGREGSRGRGRGGRSSGRGTALPSAFTGRAKPEGRSDRRRSRGGGGSGAGYEFEDGAGGASDRHKYDDEAGDSDEGPDPEDSDFEDEEVDEDAAFDSADEERYGELMETISDRRSGKQGGASPKDDASDSEEEEEEEEQGGMSLMDMLNANEAAEEAQGGPNGNTQAKDKGKGKARSDTKDEGRAAQAVEDSEAEFLVGDEMDQQEESDSEEGDDEEERHARLLGFVGSMGDKAAATDRAANDRRSSQLLKEGEFNATAVVSGGVAAGGEGSRKGTVTIETLMGSLQNSKGFAAVKSQVAAFSGKLGAPAAPTHKAAELRAEREAAYSTRKSDMGKWVAPVQANRQAETLDFTQTVRTNVSNASLASKMEATTDMEREVEMLLTAGGTSEAGLAEAEMEELKSKAYTVEEVRERQAELSKMRALMFYQERKQHHVNKIKSKVYRKIKKRQRDRAGEAKAEANGELGEDAARKRAEERMNLRHKNTTKWVKSALRARGGAGKDDRKAISEQLRLGQELRAKMDGIENSSSDDDVSSEDDDVGNPAGAKKKKAALRKADRQALEDMGEEDGKDMDVGSGKGAAILKMAFMQKAMNKQRERAKEEASVLLRELEDASAAAAEQESEEDDTRMDPSNKGKKGKARGGTSWAGEAGVDSSPSTKRISDDGRDGTRASKEGRAKAAAEVAKTIPAGALQSSAVSMDSRVRSSVASPITVDLGGGGGEGDLSMGVGRDQAEGTTRSLNRAGDGAKADDMAAESAVSKRRRETDEVDRGVVGISSRKGASRGGAVDASERDEGGEGEGGDNPWLAPTPRRSKQRRRINDGNSGEVLLDVRKAAATALSAFGGTSDGGKQVAANGEARGAVERENGALQGSENGAGKGKHQKGGDGREGGRGKKKKGGTGSGNDGRQGGEAGDGTSRQQQTTTDGRGKTNKSTAQQANGNRYGDTGTKLKDAAGGGGAAPRPLAGLSNDELVRRAFAAPDFETEFKDSKEDGVESAVSKGREKMPKDLAGWGAWAGEGAPVPRGPTKRQVLAKKAQTKKEETLKRARKDDRLPKVVINEKRQKRSAKYMVSEIPYPFTSREQYERSLRQPIGGEWNTSQSVRDMTRPSVMVRAGTVVAPMKLGKLHRENAKDKEAVVAARKGGGASPAGARRGAGGSRGGEKTGR